MKMKLIIASIIVSVLGTLVGCKDMDKQKVTTKVYIKEKEQVTVPNAQEKHEREQKLMELLQKMEQIYAATVLISDDVAIVGVKIADGFDNNEVPHLKKKIEEEIKKLDMKLKRVAVSVSPEMFDRLEKITSPKDEKANEVIDEISPIL